MLKFTTWRNAVYIHVLLTEILIKRKVKNGLIKVSLNDTNDLINVSLSEALWKGAVS